MGRAAGLAAPHARSQPRTKWQWLHCVVLVLCRQVPRLIGQVSHHPAALADARVGPRATAARESCPGQGLGAPVATRSHVATADYPCIIVGACTQWHAMWLVTNWSGRHTRHHGARHQGRRWLRRRERGRARRYVVRRVRVQRAGGMGGVWHRGASVTRLRTAHAVLQRVRSPNPDHARTRTSQATHLCAPCCPASGTLLLTLTQLVGAAPRCCLCTCCRFVCPRR